MKSSAVSTHAPSRLHGLLGAVVSLALSCAACSSTGGPPEILGEDGGASTSLITNGSDLTPPSGDSGAPAADAADVDSGVH